MRVLVVDDQRSARRVITTILATIPDVVVHEAASLEEARAMLAREELDLALIDIRLEDDPRNRDGLILLREIKDQTAIVPVMVTAFSDMAEIRAAMRTGAWDYVLKDGLCEELLLPIIEAVRTRQRLESEVLALRARAGSAEVPGLIGSSTAMERLRAQIRRVAVSDRPVLVAGPSGAGKELVVRAIHALGATPEAPLLDLNCGAIPEALMESQLFGHERGAFTGADRRAHGLLATVGRGTLFLDEIAEMPLPLQAKLLRVLETGRYRAVGASADLAFEGRVVAATHASLAERVRDGRFREDLLHRLDVLRIRVPSLDERRDDIPALVAHFAGRQREPLRLSADAIEALRTRPWPGNVRELRNMIDRLAVFCDDDPITRASLEALESPADDAGDDVAALARAVLRTGQGDRFQAVERALVEEAMRLAGGNKTAAARLLGVHRKAVERRVGTTDPSDGEDQ